MSIVACSADVSDDNVERCKLVGFDELIFKPVELDALDGILRKVNL
jgi:CheY-like chemotaxis protein